jgi:hypothetical protein
MRSSSSTVRHAETGAILAGPEAVDLTFRAYGGQRALEAEQQGITQRVRITERLVGWVRQTFPTTAVAPHNRPPDPFRAVKTGVRGMPWRRPLFPFCG